MATPSPVNRRRSIFHRNTSRAKQPTLLAAEDITGETYDFGRRFQKSPNWGIGLWRQVSTRSREYAVKVKQFGDCLQPETVLLIFTFIAVVLGTLTGLSLNSMFLGRQLSPRETYYLGFFGEAFLRMLKMLIIPMVISSNISSIASLNNMAARWLAVLSITYYFATALIAVIAGIIIAVIVQPGNRTGRKAQPLTHHEGAIKVFDSLLYAFRNLIPESIMRANSMSVDDSVMLNVTRNLYNGERDPHGGQNILGPIIVSIMFGVAIRNLKDEAAILAEFFHSVRRTMVYLVSIIMWISPLGIFSLIAQNIATEHDLVNSLETLSIYVATVLMGLSLHGVVVLPVLLYVVTKKNPLYFTKNMLQALICAAGTASSTATLPCTIKCLEKETSVDHRVTKFMLPMGTTINMDGTIMYEAIAVIYIAQRLNVDLFIDDLILIAITSILAGMGAASMPSAGILTMTMVLMAIGIHPTSTIMIIPVDWFLDRFRTMVNVYGDAVGAAIVSKLCEPKLASCSIPDIAGLNTPTDVSMRYSTRRRSGYTRPPSAVSEHKECHAGTGRRKSHTPKPLHLASPPRGKRASVVIGSVKAACIQEAKQPPTDADHVADPEDYGSVYVVDDNTLVFRM